MHGGRSRAGEGRVFCHIRTVREALRQLAGRDPGDEYVRLLASLEPVDRAEMWR